MAQTEQCSERERKLQAENAELKKRLKEILLSASTDPEGNDILKGMMIDRFVPGDDANYDSIRMINTWIARQHKAMK